ncbi:MAG: uroporphyrinogen-III synthase [Psychrobium sp.]
MHKHSSRQRRVLITRPQSKSQQLEALLASHHISCISYPLVQFLPCIASQIEQVIAGADIIIAVSENAVSHTDNQLSQWPEKARYFAVGKGTARQFSTLSIKAKSPALATSEGLLALDDLADVNGERVVILRGNGGRELIAQTLVNRGATVEYLETYQRQLIPMNDGDCVLQWQQHQINTIVVTSGEILQHLWENIGEMQQTWLKSLSLIVPSERIVKIARKLGFESIELSEGADNQSILKILLNEC